jgi:Tol biopolymer transport system component/C-terminal processing protease CtpA/Prc
MKHCLTRCASLLALLAGGVIAPAALAEVSPNAGMIRWPDVSKDQICFVYSNDIWVAPKSGGQARPLASPAGVESFPRFNPDGSTIAFLGNYDGNRDIYSIPLGGGIPTRITHNPAGETLCDWTPAGNLLFFTTAWSGLARQQQLWQTGPAGGLASQLPVPYGGFGGISPDGNWLAYTPHSVDTRTWKRYRGGMATDIWLFNLNDKTSQRITDWEGVDTLPMWVPGGDGKTVYYHADKGREHRMNIWAYDIATRATRQVTSFADNDVKWPSIGPGSDGKGEIVFQLGSKLMLLNLGTGQSSEVKITIPGDRPKLRPRTIDASRVVESASISPTGKRVAIEGRGDLWSAPVKEGVVRAFTRTDAIAERDPAWSPDGKWIAYFSDEGGEYNLWVRASDGRPPEKKEVKKEDKKDEKEEGTKAEGTEARSEDKKDEQPKRETRKLSDLGLGYRYSPRWSPDSKFITFVDQNGGIFLTDVEKGETKQFDVDPWMNQQAISWSSDSQWIAYARAEEKTGNGVIVIGNAKTGEKKVVTDHMFASATPVFDRKGEWLFFVSQRAVNNPEYSDIDNTYAYRESQVILMVPLNKDVKNTWLPKSDEEEFKVDKKKDEAKKDETKKDDEKKEGDKKPDAAADDALSGTWSGNATGGELPPGGMAVSFTLALEGTKVTGSASSMMGQFDVTGTFDRATSKLELTGTMQGAALTFAATLANGELKGTWSAGEQSGEFTLTKSAAGDGEGDSKGDKKDADKPKEVKIDFEGFERRALQLPIVPGNFGTLAVADGEKLIFQRTGGRGGAESGIRVYNYAGDEKKEEAVTTGGNFDLSADGKKLLVFRGGSNMVVVDPSSGGGKSHTVSTSGMTKTIQDPRAEWKHIVNEAWRLQRDFFYEPTMHGVDWPKVRDHYMAMVDDASSREDVNWIIAEMISELNIGHAYLGAPGDIEDQPNANVGLLGVDFALDNNAYKIARIIEGGPWDSDARGPLSQPGVDVKVGDYILAVNGVPIDASKDPYAAFIGTADRTTSITVSDKPALDAEGANQREVVIKPLGSEVGLRYRDWIEQKRAYVHEKSGGKVGYIYVPNTGVDGQNDLYRQFFGQRDRDALIIDDRWNGGGQIPNRFIELLNRPNTNFWAKRAGQDWIWPPDAHFGPKAMLINGLAGSGGDMFPWLFRFHKLGPLIGTRTWGGLVGISGNPRMVDGGSVTVPTFGFYETDGTWGVEGHGVDPDIEVIDDPALMQSGGDPQLDRAIAEMLKAVQERPWKRPTRPQSPNRSGMGIPNSDK